MINCKKKLPNLGEDLFFLENTLILGRKLKNMRLIPSGELFFFSKNAMILGQNLVFVRESQIIFCPIMIWKNVTKFGQNFIAPKFFLTGTPMVGRYLYETACNKLRQQYKAENFVHSITYAR